MLKRHAGRSQLPETVTPATRAPRPARLRQLARSPPLFYSNVPAQNFWPGVGEGRPGGAGPGAVFGVGDNRGKWWGCRSGRERGTKLDGEVWERNNSIVKRNAASIYH